MVGMVLVTIAIHGDTTLHVRLMYVVCSELQHTTTYKKMFLGIGESRNSLPHFPPSWRSIFFGVEPHGFIALAKFVMSTYPANNWAVMPADHL